MLNSGMAPPPGCETECHMTWGIRMKWQGQELLHRTVLAHSWGPVLSSAPVQVVHHEKIR